MAQNARVSVDGELGGPQVVDAVIHRTTLVVSAADDEDAKTGTMTIPVADVEGQRGRWSERDWRFWHTLDDGTEQVAQTLHGKHGCQVGFRSRAHDQCRLEGHRDATRVITPRRAPKAWFRTRLSTLCSTPGHSGGSLSTADVAVSGSTKNTQVTSSVAQIKTFGIR